MNIKKVCVLLVLLLASISLISTGSYYQWRQSNVEEVKKKCFIIGSDKISNAVHWNVTVQGMFNSTIAETCLRSYCNRLLSRRIPGDTYNCFINRNNLQVVWHSSGSVKGVVLLSFGCLFIVLAFAYLMHICCTCTSPEIEKEKDIEKNTREGDE
jgi:hypothetical protein